MFMYTLENSCETLKKVLTETNRFDWSLAGVLYCIAEHHKATVIFILEQRGYVALKKSRVGVWWIAKEEAINFKIRAILFALIEKQADPNTILPNGITPLHLALGNDDLAFALKVTKLILQHGGKPNIRTTDGLTPLHIAAAWGRFELVQLLVSCGADPEMRDYCHAMPIDYAAENKHNDIAQYLHYVAYTALSFTDLQDTPGFNLTLEKIMVNNGEAEAEYEVEKTSKLSQGFEHLPQTSSTELVENWCSKHAVLNKKSENILLNESSSCSSLNASRNPLFVNCKPRNCKISISENSSLEFECSSKFLSRRSLSNSKPGVDIPSILTDFECVDGSQESGIAILLNDLPSVSLVVEAGHKDQPLIKRSQDDSSDYFTSNEISGSTNILEKNVLDDVLFLDESNSDKHLHSNNETEDMTDRFNSAKVINHLAKEQSCNTESSNKDANLSIVEVYKYTDENKGIVLFENRLIVNPKSDEDDTYQSQSSKLTSLPASFVYDTDTLRKELTQCGFDPGPITKTTKRVYLRKLLRIKKSTPGCSLTPQITVTKVYSKELEQALNDPNWSQDLTFYRGLEDIVVKEFSNPDLTRRWREGTNKSSFTYLLLDPGITNNLPVRQDLLTAVDTWKTFISSIFYVGKGKRARPYAHLYEAVTHWNNKTSTKSNKKLDHILNIWGNNSGVVCLHIFQNVIPCEAFTREAAMIKALKLRNIDNKKLGDFYGTACTWSSKEQKMLGVLLLHKALVIFLNEGERQLKPADIN